ncbi:MAG: M15 family metallopeptidase [Clostridia bacterium]|nr:M15 family metallopeptidase [Clostridia bacterium]
MKKRKLKMRFKLFVALVSILGLLLILFAIFCRNGNYNEIEITTETTTEESTTQPIPPEESTTEESTTEPETTTKPPVKWDNYTPTEVLNSENWATALINKKYPLGKMYSPTLSPVIEGSSVTADTRVSDAYKLMYADALKQNIVLTPYSAYCSYSRQQSNYENKVQAFILQGMTEDEARANAEKRIEPAGCSENGAGLSVDIVSASAGFASTDEYKWLIENAHKYGFVLRYPEDKTDITGIIYQPWHWRYVGVEVANEMKSNNLCLEEYLGTI